jgi:hypothetical protein
MRRARIILLGSALLASPLAFAQQSPALDRVSIGVGGYYANSDTTIGASIADGMLAGDVNLEDDLGFDRRDVSPRLRADFLVGDHQGLSFDYYRYNRDSSKSLSRSVSWRGNTYNASAWVKGKLRFDFGSAAWRWWFGRGNDAFGLGLGAGYYKVRASVAGEATLNDESAYAESSTGASAWAPLLQVGWRHAFNDRWRMYFDASGVRKNGGKLHGHVYNASLGVEWFPWENLGLGLEYGINRIRLAQEHRRYNDSLDLRLDGPSLFLRLRF